MPKYALCVGVDNYQLWATPAWPSPNLPYSVKSAEDFRDLLLSAFGFPEENVRMMRDAWATRGGILQAVSDILAASVAGDVICLYFAGHGARVPGVSANGTPETDKFYEGFLPYSGNLITDYDLNQLIGHLEFSHVNMTVVMDSCHSGGMSEIEGAPRATGAPLTPAGIENCKRMVPLGIAVPEPGAGIACSVASGLVTSAEADHFADLAKGTLLSACAFDQFGWHVPALQNSILMAALKAVVNQGGMHISYNDLLAGVRDKAGALVNQHINSLPTYANQRSVPQLYGQRSRMTENVLEPFTFSING